ncbi:conjugative transfer region protein (TIGR03750 family) [Erwinia toletana]|uniref:Conjugative transfer region protein (TIGR03750 family) n=1 Tax=Winslowiella toletana TaxID=92490 RepID=A0ABS4PDK7_9GAMM|nr:TIGR03750 family conjugal transfer protein [Winslowiella toletana]MBP2170717.1 conjugative transfer region protein (TIGR03750 family) [Winslowiella toletana]
MATINFLPDRLNREPTVFRGLTVTELMMALAAGLMAGAVAGTLLTLFSGHWPLIPTSMLACAALCVQSGGRWLARLKRGRPDSWLYQALAAWLAQHGLGDRQLMINSDVWVIRRSLK